MSTTMNELVPFTRFDHPIISYLILSPSYQCYLVSELFFLLQSQCVNGERDHYSGTFQGTIHVVVGGAGSHLSPFSSLTPKWSLVQDYDYGFVKLTASDHSNLLFEYKKSSNGQVHDSFKISRDYRDVLACTHDSCEPTTSAS